MGDLSWDAILWIPTYLLSLFHSTVLYDACPKSLKAGVWWPQTKFGLPAILPCPKGSLGKYFPVVIKFMDRRSESHWISAFSRNYSTHSFFTKALHVFLLSTQLLLSALARLSAINIINIGLKALEFVK